MAATSSASSLGASPPIAFGDLLDLARLHNDPFPDEICEACRTINPVSRRYCKGCTGKLPAYFASSGALAAQQSGERRLARAPAQRVPLGSSCLGALLVAVAAVAGMPLMDSAPFDPPAPLQVLVPLASVALPAEAAVPARIQPQPEPGPNNAAAEAASEPGMPMAEDEDDATEVAPDRPARRSAAARRVVAAPPTVCGMAPASASAAAARGWRGAGK